MSMKELKEIAPNLWLEKFRLRKSMLIKLIEESKDTASSSNVDDLTEESSAKMTLEGLKDIYNGCLYQSWII